MSSTSFLVAWEPPPDEHVNGILMGYRVTYKKHGEILASKQNTSTTLNFTILGALEKFTAYEVNVSVFTRVGDGPAASVTVSTDQDGETNFEKKFHSNLTVINSLNQVLSAFNIL